MCDSKISKVSPSLSFLRNKMNIYCSTNRAVLQYFFIGNAKERCLDRRDASKTTVANFCVCVFLNGMHPDDGHTQLCKNWNELSKSKGREKTVGHWGKGQHRTNPVQQLTEEIR